MAFSINNRLITFAQQELVLGYSDPERQRIIGSLEQLERILKDKFKSDIKEIIRFGSYTRNTILPRQYDLKSDVDLMVVFKTDSAKYNPGTYRERLLRVLSNAYPNSISKKDFPAVKLELNHIMFDIVPAYSDDYSWSRYFYIPGQGDNWRSTTPNDINQDLSSKNQSYGNNIVRNVIRLCKHWNFGENYPLESYVMEKDIINTFFWHGDNLYDKFINVLENVADNRAGVRQALNYIKQYKGDYFTQPNEQKQFEWLQRLLPGLK